MQSSIQLQQSQNNEAERNISGIRLPPKPAPPPDPEKIYQSILDRVVPPLESTTVSFQVIGVYSLPEPWKTKNPEEDTNKYEIQFMGIKLEGGKIQPRIPTEEEKKAMEEAQSKGKKPPAPPAKGDKKKVEEEPTPEQKAKEEAERKLKEQIEAKKKAEWDALDADTKFYRTMENCNKEASLKFCQTNDKNEVSITTATGELKENTLAIFEEYVNQEQGCWIVFDKIPPLDEDDKKKKPPAGKKPVGEPEKMIRGKAWINLADFIKQGGIQTEQRVYLETVILEPQKVEEKKEEVKKEAKKESKKEAKEQEPKINTEKIYEPAKTYIHIKINLSNPINPILPKEGVPKASDLIKKKAPLPKYPVTKDATEMYKLQLKIAIEALAKEFLKFKGDAKTNEISPKNKEDFIEELNKSGKYFVLKEKLKKAAVRIAKEKYGKKIESLKGLTKDERDQFYSSLYIYLVDNMHETLNDTVKTKQQELHEEIVATKEIAQKEKDQLINKTNEEDYITKYKRLFKEAERSQEYKKAEKYLQEILKLQERDTETWLKYYKFAMKTENYQKAEECLREAISIDPENQDLLLLLGGLLANRKKFKEASIYIKTVLKADVSHINANLLMSIISESEGKQGLAKKFLEIAKRKKMRELNILHPVGSLKNLPQVLENNRTFTDEENDSVFYSLVEFLLKFNQIDFCEKASTFIQKKDTPKFVFIQAKSRFLRNDYDNSIKLLDSILEKEPRNQKALKYKGHAQFLKGDFKHAEKTYIKCIMTKPAPKSLTVYERLGIAYFNKEKYAEAKVAFFKCCEKNKIGTSNAWKLLGVSYMKLEKYNEAEDALTKANILDNTNPDIWGYIALLCLKYGKRIIQADQALKEANKLGLQNSTILSELAEEFLAIPESQKSIICYKKAIEIEPNNAVFWEKIAEVYEMEGEPDCIGCYEKALDLGKPDQKQLIADKLKTAIEREADFQVKYKGLIDKCDKILAPPSS